MTGASLRAAAALGLALGLLGVGVWLLGSAWAPAPVDDLTPGRGPAAGPAGLDGGGSVEAPVEAPAAAAAVVPATEPVVEPVVEPVALPQVDPAWLDGTAATTGIPRTALDAYARAELSAPAGCGLGWTTLAGIGWIESQHGTLGGRSLGADGRSSTPLLGPALDGVGPVAAIPATRGSARWHGDRVWDHAVGPMQFLPSTWRTWRVDGDGDGLADPNDLDDAALAAARYLCADGRDLASDDGWTGGVLSYNRSGDYLRLVHDAAVEYAARAS